MRAIVTVIGKDQVGIIANVCSLLSSYQVNVLDISQTVLQEYFTMIMVVDTSACTLDFAALVTELEQRGVDPRPAGRHFQRHAPYLRGPSSC